MSKRVIVKVVRDGIISKLSLPDSTPDATAASFSSVLSTPHLFSQLGLVAQQSVTSKTITADVPPENNKNNTDGARRLSFLPHKAPEKKTPRHTIRKGRFQCEVCPRQFIKLSGLEKHKIEHENNDKANHCDLCDATFNHLVNLRIHRVTHGLNGGEPFCPECGKIFPRLASLKAHVRLHEVNENIECDKCGEEFVTQIVLDKHKKKHLSETAGSSLSLFTCHLCSKSFEKLIDLKEHKKMHTRIRASLQHRKYKRHINRTRFANKCAECGKQFQCPSQLLRHERIHTGERPFKCEICGQMFSQKNALQSHMTKHSGDRPYKCDFCSGTFSQKGNLRAHINRVHLPVLNPGEAVLKCETCSCVFKKPHSLQAHVIRMHPNSIHPNGPLIKEIQQQYKELKSSSGNMIGASTEETIVLPGKTSQEPCQISANGIASAAGYVIPLDLIQQALENSGLVYMAAEVSPPVRVVGNNPQDRVVKNQDVSDCTTPSDKDVFVVTSTEPSAVEVLLPVDQVKLKTSLSKNRHAVWWPCLYCAKEFMKRTALVRHIRIHTHIQPFKCNLCFRSFAFKSTFVSHLRNHARKYSCNICDKLFATTKSLIAHFRLHPSAKPISCSICNTPFNTLSQLDSHKELVHQQHKHRTIRNQFWKKANSFVPFKQPVILRQKCYFQTTRVKKKVPSSYLCVLCSMTFKKLCHIRKHARIHSRDKPFLCDFCNYSSINMNTVRRHVRSHTRMENKSHFSCCLSVNNNSTVGSRTRCDGDKRLYMCPHCWKTFKVCFACKKHMEVHHRNHAERRVKNVAQETVVVDIESGRIISLDEKVEIIQDSVISEHSYSGAGNKI